MSASKERLYFLIQRAAHVLKARADAALKESAGLSTAQGAVLTILISDGPCTQRRLADRLMQRESAITTMAERLLKAGYVTRERSPSDARAWVLEATGEGRAAHAAMRAPFDEINAMLDSVFDENDAERFAAGLRAIIDRPDDD